MESADDLQNALQDLEKKIQDLKQRCHGRFELMELYKKIDELEERLISVSKPSSQQEG